MPASVRRPLWSAASAPQYSAIFGTWPKSVRTSFEPKPSFACPASFAWCHAGHGGTSPAAASPSSESSHSRNS